MEAKKEIFDRVEQSFTLFKGNFKQIFLPLFVYNILSYVVFFVLFFVFMLLAWTSLSTSIWEMNIGYLSPSTFFDSIWIINLISSVVIFIVWIISILIFYIPFFIWTIKTIKQAYNWEEIDCKENIISSFSDILKSFKTYWYIFAYVLIPALLFIFTWFILILWIINENELLRNIAWWILILSVLLFVIMTIYRWLRSIFSIYSSVDKNEYTKENFDFSISITKSKIWRIFWNFLLIWLIIIFSSSMLEWIVWLIIPESWVSEMVETGNESKDIINYILSLRDNMYNVFYILESLIYSAISTTFSAFILVFSYIFFKRLEIENSHKEEKSI